MQKEFPDQKQRAAVCHSQWRKSKKESMFSNIKGFEIRETKAGELVRSGYLATTHLDSGFYDEKREVWVKDRIAKETLEHWRDEINNGVPRANKVSVNHERGPHVVGTGMKGSARVDYFGLDDEGNPQYGLYADTLIDKTHDGFENTKYRRSKYCDFRRSGRIFYDGD